MNDDGFRDDMTLGEARDRLRDLVDDGHHCPCCTQFAKVYRRKINSGMAVSLIQMWRAAGRNWQHVPTTVGRRSAEEGKLAYWGLVEEERTRRPDGGRAGFWRITDAGESFVLDRLRVPKYARVYDSRCLGLVGDPTSIRDSLGSRFNYAELMNMPALEEDAA